MEQRARAFQTREYHEQSGSRQSHVLFKHLPKANVGVTLCTIIQAAGALFIFEAMERNQNTERNKKTFNYKCLSYSLAF